MRNGYGTACGSEINAVLLILLLLKGVKLFKSFLFTVTICKLKQIVRLPRLAVEGNFIYGNYKVSYSQARSQCQH